MGAKRRVVGRLTSVRWWGDTALTLGAVLGVACILMASAGALLDVRPLVFRSGSMLPTIATGDLGISRTVDAADLREGDIVSVIDSRGRRVTHRIVTLEREGSRATLTLKGDDNEIPDAEPYDVSSAERVLFSIPKAGYVVSWLSGPIGIFLFGSYVAVLVAVLFGRRRDPSGDDRGDGGEGHGKRRNGGHKQRRSTARGAAGLAVLAVAAAGATQQGAVPTLAAWNDAASAAGGTFGAHTVASQVAPSCEDKGGVLGLLGYSTLTWKHVDTRYEYVWVATRVSNGTVLNSGTVSPTSAVGTDVSLDISTSLLNLGLGGQNVDVTVRARLKDSPSWLAATPTTTRVHTVALLVGLSVRCGSV